MDWLAFKLDIVRFTGLDRDALHVYAALILHTLAAVILRRDLADWRPWLVVAMAALLNEGADIYSEVWPDHALQAGKAVHDLVNTMIAPSFILLVARRWPSLFGRTRS